MEHELRPPRDSKDGSLTSVAEKGGGNNTRIWLMFGTAVSLLLIVLLVLPALVPEADNGQKSSLDETKTASTEEQTLTASAEEQLRMDTQRALQAFLRLQAQPDLGNAETWSTDGWNKAMDTARQGDDAFGEGSFALALETYQSAGAQLQSILDNRDQLLQQSLLDGWQRLHNNAITDATASFELVLAMQAGNQQAQSGLERAAVRGQVLELVAEGQLAEAVTELHLAAQAYMAAAQLDPLYEPAEKALIRVQNQLKELAFQDAMGRSLRALDNGKFATAEKALNEAAKIKAGDSVVKEIRGRLISARRQHSLVTLRARTAQLVVAENWTAAIQAYQQALAIDAKASFAVNGLTRAQTKQTLHRQLDHYLGDSTRLFSDQPLNNARELLAANQKVSGTEPVLAGKIARLEEAVRMAVIPVDLLLISDNLTQVTVYKVGRLGKFEQKQLSLRPGKYTITGSRQGYKDVLKVIELKPGSSGQSLQIRSEEAI
jgi:hypothetical protein